MLGIVHCRRLSFRHWREPLLVLAMLDEAADGGELTSTIDL
jgi:hypothetical protein